MRLVSMTNAHIVLAVAWHNLIHATAIRYIHVRCTVQNQMHHLRRQDFHSSTSRSQIEYLRCKPNLLPNNKRIESKKLFSVTQKQYSTVLAYLYCKEQHKRNHSE